MSEEPRMIEVCICPDPDRPKRKPMAYTLWYNQAWPGVCIHRVLASTGKLAKIAAIHAHRAGVGCMPNGRAS